MWDSLTLANGKFSTLKIRLRVRNQHCEIAAGRYLLSSTLLFTIKNRKYEQTNNIYWFWCA